MSKFIRTVKRVVFARDCKEEGIQSDCFRDRGAPFGVMRMF